MSIYALTLKGRIRLSYYGRLRKLLTWYSESSFIGDYTRPLQNNSDWLMGDNLARLFETYGNKVTLTCTLPQLVRFGREEYDWSRAETLKYFDKYLTTVK